MNEVFSVYCDESCHLERDESSVMTLGAVWCPKDQKKSVARDLKALKKKHSLASNFEIKWTKVSDGKLDFYLDLVRFFFDDPRLNFRGLVIPKEGLNHEAHGQDHDDFYYKMYYLLLNKLPSLGRNFEVFIDIKDTCSQEKVDKLKEILAHKTFFEKIQQVDSKELIALQLADLLIGALSFHQRGLYSIGGASKAKKAIVNEIHKHLRFSLSYNTPIEDTKFNVFHWKPQS